MFSHSRKQQKPSPRSPPRLVHDVARDNTQPHLPASWYADLPASWYEEIQHSKSRTVAPAHPQTLPASQTGDLPSLPAAEPKAGDVVAHPGSECEKVEDTSVRETVAAQVAPHARRPPPTQSLWTGMRTVRVFVLSALLILSAALGTKQEAQLIMKLHFRASLAALPLRHIHG